MSDAIQISHDGAVTLITIKRPEKMNALDFSANDALVNAFKAFDEDEAARVAVITGHGVDAFCAGADLKSYTMAFATRQSPEFRQRYTNGYGLGGITRGMHIDKPIIAAVNGYAISGGLEIALACDIRFCADNAQFGLQDVKWGFHACDGALVRLKDIVGLGNAMEIVLSGDLVDASHALRIGLVNRVFPNSKLLDSALSYAQKLATRAPLAQRFAKEVIRRSHGLSLDEALRLESASFHDLAFSEDLKEGTAAFKEKRAARFKGE
jgi:enoyl-CoA hydratase/carnithine racemase